MVVIAGCIVVVMCGGVANLDAVECFSVSFCCFRWSRRRLAGFVVAWIYVSVVVGGGTTLGSGGVLIGVVGWIKSRGYWYVDGIRAVAKYFC